MRHDRRVHLCRGTGPGGRAPRRQGGGGELHPGHPGRHLAGVYAAGGVFPAGLLPVGRIDRGLAVCHRRCGSGAVLCSH